MRKASLADITLRLGRKNYAILYVTAVFFTTFFGQYLRSLHDDGKPKLAGAALAGHFLDGIPYAGYVLASGCGSSEFPILQAQRSILNDPHNQRLRSLPVGSCIQLGKASPLCEEFSRIWGRGLPSLREISAPPSFKNTMNEKAQFFGFLGL